MLDSKLHHVAHSGPMTEHALNYLDRQICVSGSIVGRQVIVLAILLLAFGLRVYGMTFGVPFEGFYWWDERSAIVKAADIVAHFEPAAVRSGLYSFALSLIYYPLSVVQNHTLNPRAIHLLSINARLLIARTLTVLAGTALVGVIYALGRRLTGRRSAMWAAFLTAVSPALVAESRYATTGMHVTVLIYATLLPLTDRRLSLWKRLILGLVIAFLAMLTKRNGVVAFAFPPSVLAAALLALPKQRQWTRSSLLRVGVVLGISLIGLLIAVRLSGATGVLQYLRSASGYARNASAISPLLAWRQLIKYEWLLIAGGTVGSIFAALRRRSRARALPVATFVVLYGASSLFFSFFCVRWLMVIVPGLALLTGFAIARQASARPRWARTLVSAVLLVMGTISALSAGRIGYALLHDVRIAAWEWVQQHLPAGARVAVDAYALPVGEEIFTRYRVQWGIEEPLSYLESDFHYILAVGYPCDCWQSDPDAYRSELRHCRVLVEGCEEVATFRGFLGTVSHHTSIRTVCVLRIRDVPLYPVDSLVLGAGWHGIEVEEASGTEFRWMTEQGQVFYNWSGMGESVRMLSFDAYVFPEKDEISIHINGQHVDTRALGVPGVLHHVEIPLTLSPGLNEIQLVSERGCGRPIAFDPNSRDTRCLSIKVANLTFDSAK
ncbi:MAG TPA: hypothetical protein ENI39_04495 [Anaerolineae bacterium]|nr:hypothetical protein [Anaerolineae bacterium]